MQSVLYVFQSEKCKEETGGRKREGNNGREYNFIAIELELKYIAQLTN
jgi:hypothetical protein